MAIALRANRKLQRLEEQENRISALLYQCREITGIQRASTLNKVVREIDESAMTAEKKLELFDESLALTIKTITELSQRDLQSSMPLEPDQLELINKIFGLTELLDSRFATISTNQRGVDEKFVMHRRLRLLLEQVSITAVCYMPWAKDLWIRIHGIYIEATKQRATEYRAPGFEGSEPEPTIERLYVVAVLTAAADPYQMAHKEIINVRKLVVAIGNAVKVEYIKTPTVAAPVEHRILVDQRINKPNLPYRSGRELDQHNVVLDIAECHDGLTKRLAALHQKKNGRDPLFTDMRRSAVVGMYRHVLAKWSAQPKRYSERVAANAQFDLVVNYVDIIESLFTNSDLQHAFQVDDKKPAVARTFDVSETGYGLRIRPDAEFQLGVGECIAMREHGDDAAKWQLVVVRWIRNGADGFVEVGTFRLPGSLFAAKLLSIHKLVVAGGAQSKAPQIIPVLVTSDDSLDAPMKVQMLVHRVMDNGELPHWLTFAGHDRLIISMNAVMSTRDVAIYECELSKPRRKPDFDVKPEEAYKISS